VTLAFMSDTGIVVVVIAVVVLFGASQIPKLARNLGEASRELRRAHAEVDAEPSPAAAVASTPERVTLTRGELDALLAERETLARRAALDRPTVLTGAEDQAPGSSPSA
jgi:TatA/E family protein of Tat protein translocase